MIAESKSIGSQFLLQKLLAFVFENMPRVKQRSQPRKKRKFCGNQHTKVLDSAEGNKSVEASARESLHLDEGKPLRPISETSFSGNDETTLSSNYSSTASFRKIQDIQGVSCSTPKTESRQPITGYRFMDMDILANIMSSFLCPACCNHTLLLKENFSEKMGLASSLEVACECGFSKKFYTSKLSGRGYEVNRRVIYAMRSCGQGYAGIQKFTMLMNMPKPMTANNYDKMTNNIRNAAQLVAQETMQEAANEVRNKSEGSGQAVVNTGISCDGTWQKRGYSSLNGVTTVISMENGKVLDMEPMVRTCKACKLKENLKVDAPDEYANWRASHECPVDYFGSAPNMENVAAKRIFGRSIERNNLRYVDFYGDGDSKGYSAVQHIYPGITMKKFECIGHVQKRVGTRLRKLKQSTKGLGGKGKLTSSIIDKLQNYYGIAIRQNAGNKEGMKKAIHASLLHVASSSKNNWHNHCPEGTSQALLGMACDRSRTPWRTPSGSKECNRSHALSFQTRIKILYSSVTISQSGSTKSKILNNLIVIIKLFTKDNPAGCNITQTEELFL